MASNPKPRPQFAPIYLRQWRKYRNKTQEQLAEALGISAAQVNRIEKGKRQYTQTFLEAAAEYLETDPASLLMRDPTQAEAIWSIWERIEPAKRSDALRILDALTTHNKKAG